ncbi:hypothetical protein [Tenacibaculum mesophilum]|uniref:hypothetical protein n=1 Tax=Tenacibaculum mesophilum TaxID=104268 RepID=UPI0006495C1E|nr:hypothetical protein [Tenacibaculum mesophilum]
MTAKRKTSEAQILEKYRIALTNVLNQTEIANQMAQFGYDTTKIEIGNQLWQQANNAYNTNKSEDDETFEAYTTFSNQKKQLTQTYNLHRKKAKIIFRKKPVTLEKLAVTGTKPQAYINWLETLKKFYSTANTSAEIQEQLQTLNISQEEITNTITQINNLESARANYLKEKGESQDATKAKDQAFAKIEDWMRDFYAVASIALEDQPQLIEALSKQIKS